jgi:hypothetical protein
MKRWTNHRAALDSGSALYYLSDKQSKTKLLKQLKLKQMVAEWRQKKRSQKTGFGAPVWARGPAKTVTSAWFVPGGGIETNRTHH